MATELPRDESKDYVGSLQIIRLMLDKTKTVDEAVKLFDKYNIHMRGGPNIHYLIADADGHSALVELKDGKINIHRGKTNWQSATQFLYDWRKQNRSANVGGLPRSIKK